MGSNLTQDYLQTKKDLPFSWKDNNCLSFVVEYVNLSYPLFEVDWFLGHDTAQGCYRAYRKKCKELGYKNIVDAFDDNLDAEITLYPRPGFVVAKPVEGLVGYAFGIHSNGLNHFLTDKGLVSLQPEPKDLYWSIP